MKKFEKIMILIALLGIIFKLLNIPLSSFFLVISMLSLSSLYFYLGFALFNNVSLKKAFKSESYKGVKSIGIVMLVGFGSGLSILTIGILFNLLNYPLQQFFINVGIITTSLFMVFNLIIIRNEKGIQQGIIVRAAISILIGITLLILPIHFIDKVQYRNHPRYLDVLIKLKNDPDNEELLKQFEEEELKMILGEEHENYINKD